jgi:hypothetical protein
VKTKITTNDKVMLDSRPAVEPMMKKDVAGLDLRIHAELRAQAGGRRFRGKLKWEGDLDNMRIDK